MALNDKHVKYKELINGVFNSITTAYAFKPHFWCGNVFFHVLLAFAP